jgi:hypothetical protein
MSISVYAINKGINKPIEFKGFKAQYLWYLAGGLLVLLVLFAVLYICGVNTFFCLGIILVLGVLLFVSIGRLSHRYGEHGLMKKLARKAVPRILHSNRRIHL